MPIIYIHMYACPLNTLLSQVIYDVLYVYLFNNKRDSYFSGISAASSAQTQICVF